MIELCMELMHIRKMVFRGRISASVKGTPSGNLLGFC